MSEPFQAHPAQIALANIFSSPYLMGPPVSEKSVRLVAHLFTPEEAEVAKFLPYYYPRPLERTARKAGRSPEEIKPLLEAMSAKRVIYRSEKGNYALIPLIPGIFEMSLMNGADTAWHREQARLLNDLFATGFSRKYNTPGAPTALRTIPVQSAVESQRVVVHADLVSELIARHELMGVLNVCQCRQAAHFVGRECKRSSPQDGCLAFGSFAASLGKSGDGRLVSKAEMRSIVQERWDKKLFFWSVNVTPENPTAICTCCECCCHELENINYYGGKVGLAEPHFLVEFNEALCDHCGKCAKACNLFAHTLVEKKHRYDRSKCLGCGVCIPTCKPGAIQMKENPAYQPPSQNYLRLGLKSAAELAWSGIKSKLTG
jgi:Na+-translocating ferredoxin:NAD+ oxidoreductase subunit B